MPTVNYNLTYAATDICSSNSSSRTNYSNTDGYYLDDGGDQHLTSFRFSGINIAGATAVTSAILTLVRAPSSWTNNGATGTVSIRCEATATPAALNAGAIPKLRTFRATEIIYTFAANTNTVAIDITPIIEDLRATYGAITALHIGVGAAQMGWMDPEDAVSWRVLTGSTTPPAIAITFTEGGGTPVAIAGTSTGTSTVTGALSLIASNALSGAASGTSTANGMLNGRLRIAGNATGASTVIGALSVPSQITSIGPTLLPTTPDGVPQQVWQEGFGQRNGFIDNHANGSGQRVIFARSVAKVYAYVKSATATSWSGPIFVCNSDSIARLRGVAQDSSGAVHVLMDWAGSDRYYRFTINYSGGNIASFTQAATFSWATGPAVGANYRASIAVITAQNGTERVWCLRMYDIGTYPNGMFLHAEVTQFPVTATSSAAMIGITGTGTWTALSSGVKINAHDHAIWFAQFANSRNVVASVGYTCAELSGEYPGYMILTANGATTWSVGSEIVETTSGTERALSTLGGMYATDDGVYRMSYGDNVNHRLFFDRINLDGSITYNVFPYIGVGQWDWSGWSVLGVRNSSRAYLIASMFSGNVMLAVFNGASWDVTGPTQVGVDGWGFDGFGHKDGAFGLQCQGDGENLSILSIDDNSPNLGALTPTVSNAVRISSATGTGVNSVTTPAFSSVANSTIFAFACVYDWDNQALDRSAPNDNKSNTYTQIGTQARPTNHPARALAAFANASGARGTGHTLTKNFLANSGATLSVLELLHAGSVSDYTVGHIANPGLANPLLVAPTTHATGQSLLVLAVSGDSYVTATTSAAGWQLAAETLGSATSQHCAVFVKPVTASGDYPCAIQFTGAAQGATTISFSAPYADYQLSGTALGSSIATATLRALLRVAGAANGTANVIATMRALLRLAGAANGVSTVSGTTKGASRCSGTVTATSTANGILSGTYRIAATVACFSTATGDLRGAARVQGSANGTASSSGTLKGLVSLSSTVINASTATGVLHGLSRLSANSNGAAVVSGALRGLAAVAAVAVGTSTATGNLIASGANAIAGNASGTSTASGDLRGISRVQGSANGSSTISALLSGAVRLAGASNGQAAVFGGIVLLARISGATNGTSAAAGNLALIGGNALSGIASGTSSAVGDLRGASRLSGSSSGSSVVTGAAVALARISATSTGTATAFGALFVGVSLSGSISGSSSVTGALFGISRLAAVAHGTSYVSGQLIAPGAIIQLIVFGARRMAEDAGIDDRRLVELLSVKDREVDE